MRPIKVLVADDSSLMRSIIKGMLSLDEGIHVIGEACDGKEAVQKVLDLQPDIVTMDIQMPVMDGLEAIERIMAVRAVPILVISSRINAATAYSAISKGALEVFPIARVDPEIPRPFLDKIRLLSQVKVITHIAGSRTAKAMSSPAGRTKRHTGGKEWVVGFASSMGGPRALSTLLPELPEDLPASVVIAQHISDGFVGGLVEWMDRICALRVKTADDGEMLQPGTIYFSPSDRHTVITEERRVRLVPGKRDDIYHPSCDALLSSLASVYGFRSVGVILTGMGSDGAKGIERIKKAGGITLAQDEKTSAVFGMPKVAIDSGYIDRVLPLNRIGREIVRLVVGDRSPVAMEPGER